MSTKHDYAHAKKMSHATINWLSVLYVEVKSIYQNHRNDFKKFILAFWLDLRYAKNFQHRLAALVAGSFIVWYVLYLPINSIGHWLYWEIREASISYQEFPIPASSEIESGVNVFASEYSQAFGSNCEWFRKHDVDIAMYEKYKRLRRDPYPCASFQRGNRVILSPLRIGNVKQDGVFNTVEILFSKLEYNDNRAIQYRTIWAKLWQLGDEGPNTWRIDKMKIEQQVNVSS